jgi:hypothetical protein
MTAGPGRSKGPHLDRSHEIHGMLPGDDIVASPTDAGRTRSAGAGS